MRKAKADYTYDIIVVEGVRFLMIEDVNQGAMSVTNDIENVLHDIQLARNVKDCIVLYKDSDGQWDGYSEEMDAFFHNGATTPSQAIRNYLNNKRKG